jgi:uncharacterized protein YcfJ
MEKKDLLNELSLLPNLGLGGVQSTTGTLGTGSTTSVTKPGSKTQNIAKTTTALTKQINDITTKITAAKDAAAKTNTADQQKLLQTIALLQNQLQQLTKSEQEESTKNKVGSLYKTVSKTTGEYMGARTGIPYAGKALGKIGAYNAEQMSKFLGLDGEEDAENTERKPLKKKNIKALEAAPLLAAVGSLAAKGVAANLVSKGINKLSKRISNNEDQESMKKANKKKTNPNHKKEEKLEEGILKKGLGGVVGGSLGSTVGGAAGTALGAVVGGPIGAGIGGTVGKIAGGIAGTGAGAEFMDDDEESHEKLTDIQDKIVNALSKRKYSVNKVSYQFANEEGGPTVYMMKKPNRYSTHYAEVSPDGMVNGETLEDFLGSRDENEEKILSHKQQRIANLAGDPNKIDGADFAKLRAMKEAVDHKDCKAAERGCKCNKCKECKANQPKKESVEIPTFLRAILRKNYAQADKYLGSIVNEKIKSLINKALDKNL